MREALRKDSLPLRETSLRAKAVLVLRNRPRQFFAAARCLALFYWARAARALFSLDGVILGANVRLQRNRSVLAEAPAAQIVIGDHSVIYEDSRLESYGRGRIEIGECSILGGARIVSRYEVKVGARFLSSWNVFIQDYDAHPTDPMLRAQQVEHMASAFRPSFDVAPRSTAPPAGWSFPGERIVIGDDVWVGAGVSILKGAQIGNGCIIATGAVVLRGEYPPGSVIAGNPARIVKTIPSRAPLQAAC